MANISKAIKQEISKTANMKEDINYKSYNDKQSNINKMEEIVKKNVEAKMMVKEIEYKISQLKQKKHMDDEKILMQQLHEEQKTMLAINAQKMQNAKIEASFASDDVGLALNTILKDLANTEMGAGADKELTEAEKNKVYSAIHGTIHNIISLVVTSHLKNGKNGENIGFSINAIQESIIPHAEKLNSIIDKVSPLMSQYWEKWPASKAHQAQFAIFLLSVANSDKFEAQLLARNFADKFFDSSVTQNLSAIIEIDKAGEYKIDYPKIIGEVFRITPNLPLSDFKQVTSKFSPTISFIEKFAQMDMSFEHKSELGRIVISAPTILEAQKIELLKKIYQKNNAPLEVTCSITIDYLIALFKKDYKKTQLSPGAIKGENAKPKLLDLIEQSFGLKIDETKWLTEPYEINDLSASDWEKWLDNFNWAVEQDFDMNYSSVLAATPLFISTIAQMKKMTRNKGEFYSSLATQVVLTLNLQGLGFSSDRFANIFNKHLACTQNPDKDENLHYSFWNTLYAIGLNSMFTKSLIGAPLVGEKDNPTIKAITHALEQPKYGTDAHFAALALILSASKRKNHPKLAKLAHKVVYSKTNHNDFAAVIEKINEFSALPNGVWSGGGGNNIFLTIAEHAGEEVLKDDLFFATLNNSSMPWWWQSTKSEKTSMMGSLLAYSILLMTEKAQKGDYEYLSKSNIIKQYLSQLLEESHKYIDNMGPEESKSRQYGKRILSYVNIICDTWPELRNTMWKSPLYSPKGLAYYCVGDVLEKEWGVTNQKYLNSHTIVNNIYAKNFKDELPPEKIGFFSGIFRLRNKSKALTFEQKLLKIEPFREHVSYIGINKDGPYAVFASANPEQSDKNKKAKEAGASEAYMADILEFLSDMQTSDTVLETSSMNTKIKTQSLLLEATALAQLIGATNTKLDTIESIQVKQIIGHCRESVQTYVDGKNSLTALINLKKSDEAEGLSLNQAIFDLETQYNSQLSILTSQLEKIQALIYTRIQGNTLKTSMVQSTFLKNKFNDSGQEFETVNPATKGGTSGEAINIDTDRATPSAGLGVISQKNGKMMFNDGAREIEIMDNKVNEDDEANEEEISAEEDKTPALKLTYKTMQANSRKIKN